MASEETVSTVKQPRGPLVAAEIEIERGEKNASELFPQRRGFGKERRKGVAHVSPIAAIGLDVEGALVAEGAVEARPVEPGRGAELVERGGGEVLLREDIHRPVERGLLHAKARACLRGRGELAV